MADNNEGGRNDGVSNGSKGPEGGVDGTQPLTNGPTNHDSTLPESTFSSSSDASTAPVSSVVEPISNPVYITTGLTPGLPTGPPSAGLGLTGYSPFSSTGDGSWTPTFDPMGLGGGFGFNHSGVPLQNQFFFPSNDIGVWGQDSLMVNNSWLVNPVPIDPQSQITNPGAQVGMEVGSNMNPVGTLGQSFSGMSLNGSMHNLIPALGTPAIIPAGVPAAPGQNVVPPTQPTPVVQPPVATPPQPEKPKSWAAIASQPAKPKPPPPQKQSPETETSKKQPQQQQQSQAWAGQSGGSGRGTTTAASVVSSGNNQSGRGPRRATVPKSTPVETTTSTAATGPSSGHSEVVSKLKAKNNYNPSELTVNMTNARFFVIKSYAEDDVHRSIKYNVWCSTEHGNRRLDGAYREQKAKGGNVYLFFSVNGSGHFCGVAQMASEIDFGSDTGLWTQDKWKGRFDLKWLYVKDVPNNQLRHIRLENNENKPVTNSRDTQEVPSDKGRTIMKLMHSYNHTTSIFDDFEHYEKRQEEDGNLSSTTNSGSKKDSRSS